MTPMNRIKISIAADQEAWLRAEAQRLGIKIAELVRRILDERRGK